MFLGLREHKVRSNPQVSFDILTRYQQYSTPGEEDSLERS